MRRTLIAALTVALLGVGACAHVQREEAPGADHRDPEPGAGMPPPGMPSAASSPIRATDPRLRGELLQMVKEDQAVRDAWVAAGLDDKAAADRLQAVDARNTTRMKAIVADHGWPTVAMVGPDGVKAAFLLVQHADGDPAFQAACLPHVEAAAARGELEKQHVALLTDRVLLARGEPQRYGTQFESQDGDWVPQPIADPANVDARRAQMELMPLAEYKALLIKAYGRPKPDLAPVPKASPAYSRPAR